MSPHETLVVETRAWLDRARADLHACVALIAAGLPAEALFHAQQCAEKAMKAVLTWHQVSFKKTHDLDELKQACLPYAGDATAQLTGVERLSQYAWRFRYPGAAYTPERTEAEEAQKRAGQLLGSITALLESQFGDWMEAAVVVALP
jgi:HEPN domain-containing protein